MYIYVFKLQKKTHNTYLHNRRAKVAKMKMERRHKDDSM